MAGDKGFGNLVIKYGRSDKGVTNPGAEGNSTKRLQTNGAQKSPTKSGMSMGGHIRTYGHANTSSNGGNKSGSHKAAK